MAWVASLGACGDGSARPGPDAGQGGWPLGAVIDEDSQEIRLGVASRAATRIEAWFYADALSPEPMHTAVLQREAGSATWSLVTPLDRARSAGSEAVFYGLRAWGPNWPHVADWQPGTERGFESDVDGEGNRFNPNKLLIDPYAVELSRDPAGPDHDDGRGYATGPEYRSIDSGPFAPRSIALPASSGSRPEAPGHPLADDLIYEVHLRGLTAQDSSVPAELRGTYAGAALVAPRLKALGVTAIELLPVQETSNDQNDIDPNSTHGDNYWGYSTLAFFAPDRRYASDRRPGGPTDEFRRMVDAFHEQGIKVYIDVVYNHSGEGGTWGGDPATYSLLSWRGLDNASYYSLTDDRQAMWDNTGVHGNLKTADPIVKDLIVDSLRYWHEDMGVDGFRFDLATVLGNVCEHGCFDYRRDSDTALQAISSQLPVRPGEGGAGVDLIAEPWAIGGNSYQLGNLPAGYAEWNDGFRDDLRASQNKRGVQNVTPGTLAQRISGSPELFGDDGRSPPRSVNFLVAHDGLTLADLYRCNDKDNQQPWPYGPSDGGTDNNTSWDQGGDPALQARAARTGLALLMLSGGTPMVTGGDEFLRSLRCNNNPYNLDSPANWVEVAESDFTEFFRRAAALRASRPELRPRQFLGYGDGDGDQVAQLSWYRANGAAADAAFFADPEETLLAWRIDADEAGGSGDFYGIYNAGTEARTAVLPTPQAGWQWAFTLDSCAEEVESAAPRALIPLDSQTVDICPRSVVALVGAPIAR